MLTVEAGLSHLLDESGRFVRLHLGHFRARTRFDWLGCPLLYLVKHFGARPSARERKVVRVERRCGELARFARDGMSAVRAAVTGRVATVAGAGATRRPYEVTEDL